MFPTFLRSFSWLNHSCTSSITRELGRQSKKFWGKICGTYLHFFWGALQLPLAPSQGFSVCTGLSNVSWTRHLVVASGIENSRWPWRTSRQLDGETCENKDSQLSPNADPNQKLYRKIIPNQAFIVSDLYKIWCTHKPVENESSYLSCIIGLYMKRYSKYWV